MMKSYVCFTLLLLALALALGTTAQDTPAPSPPTPASAAPPAPAAGDDNNTTDVTTAPAADLSNETDTTEPSTVNSTVSSTAAPSSNITTGPPVATTTHSGTNNTNNETTTDNSSISNNDTTTSGTTAAPANVTDTNGTTAAPTTMTNPNASTSKSPSTNTSLETSTAPATTTTPNNSTTTQPTPSPTPTPQPTPSPTPTPQPTPTPTPQPSTSNIVISETNLLLATDQFFVELEGDKNAVLENLTVVIKNGTSGANVFSIQYNASSTLDSSTRLFVQQVDKKDVENLVAVAVVLYKPDANVTLYDDVQDYVVYASASVHLDPRLSEGLPTSAPLRLVGTNKTRSLTMSRIDKTPQDNSAFVLASSTKNASSLADLTLSQFKVTLQLHPTGKDQCQTNNNQSIKTLNEQLAGIVPDCGLSTQQIVGKPFCQGDLFYPFKLNQSYKGQGAAFLSGFSQYVLGNQSVTISGQTYKVVNCTQQCLPTGHHQPPADSKNGNIKVTVAVVLSCIVVFLLILVSVIFYMRRKRRGIMRQFRMTRLQEDDDMDDMEDFMGAIDQEPSFSSSRNNLTT